MPNDNVWRRDLLINLTKQILNNIMATTIKKGELRITDTLNYEVFKNMTEENRTEMVKWRTKEILNRDVVNIYNDSKRKEIPIGDNTLYKVTAEFSVIDFMLNKKGILNARMLCKRDGEDIDVTVREVSYKEIKSHNN